jgi:NAD(P)-dependent dehydrogenase (short-subunit alcohol dehydrogenase family)
MAPMTTFSLGSRKALVTGGSSGIGEEIGRQMAAAGASVALVGRNEERLGRVVKGIEEDGGTAHAIVADLTDQGAPDRVVKEAVDRLDGLDILANVAGIFETGPMDSTTMESYDRQFALNVRAHFFVTKAALPRLRESSHAVVIFISSMAALAAFPQAAAYSATKGAIESLGRALSVELAPLGIRVNVIAPGEINTPMNVDFYAENPQFVKDMETWTPAGRLGTAADIAPAAVFLASDAARFIYGVSLSVDGGVVAR